MSLRRVIGGVGLISPDARANGKGVTFALVPGSYTSTTQYPQQKVVAQIVDGEIDVELWANEEGTAASEYVCTLPSGEQFRFTLPPDVEPAELSALRLLGIGAATPQGESVLAIMEAQFATAFNSTQQLAIEATDAANEAAQNADSAKLDAEAATEAALEATTEAVAATEDAIAAAADTRAATEALTSVVFLGSTPTTVDLYIADDFGFFTESSITIGGITVDTVILETV